MIHVRYLLMLFAAFALASTAWADFYPFSGAEVARNIAVFRVEADGVRLELEIHPDDLEMFFPNEFIRETSLTKSLQSGPEENGSLGISISGESGAPLSFAFTMAERRERVDRASPMAGALDPISGRIIPAPPDDPDVIYIEGFYSFPGTPPDALIFRAPLALENDVAVSIGFMVFDREVPITRFSYLSADARLAIDWSDPWYSTFSNTNLNRPAQSGTTSFIYVEPREIRHEVLIRLRELSPWINTDLPTGSQLEPAQQQTVLNIANEVFKDRNPVTVGGDKTQPASITSSFLTLNETGIQVVENSPALVVDTTFVGLIMSYPISTLPEDASVTWDMFDQTIQDVPVTLTDIAGPFLDWATPDSPEVRWVNYLKRYTDPKVQPVAAKGIVFVPIWSVAALFVSLVLVLVTVTSSGVTQRKTLILLAACVFVAGSTLRHQAQIPFQNPFSERSEGEEAAETFFHLLENTYLAALEVSPQARGDALEPIVSEVALADVATELETNLAIRLPSGSRANVAEIIDVSIVEGDMTLSGAFEGVAHWLVDARASHWGHDHRRRVEYRARVAFHPEDGVWRLTGITVLKARALDV